MVHRNVMWITVNDALRHVAYLKKAVYGANPQRSRRILASDIRESLRKDITDLIKWSKIGGLAMTLLDRLDNLDESPDIDSIMIGMSHPEGIENTLRAFLEETGFINVEPTNASPMVKALMDRR